MLHRPTKERVVSLSFQFEFMLVTITIYVLIFKKYTKNCYLKMVVINNFRSYGSHLSEFTDHSPSITIHRSQFIDHHNIEYMNDDW